LSASLSRAKPVIAGRARAIRDLHPVRDDGDHWLIGASVEDAVDHVSGHAEGAFMFTPDM
jgi:hypothetical protein